MTRNTEARDALRSYLPEQQLIGDRDFEALTFKYEAQNGSRLIGSRAFSLLDINAYRKNSTREQSKSVGMIDFDGVSLEIGAPLFVTGLDPEAGVEVRYDSCDASMLHVEYIKGPQHLRDQLAEVAHYIDSHESVRETPYVMGVTYDEMARIGVRAGMRPINITVINDAYNAELHARHKLLFANNVRARQFTLSAVYLPTDEFVDRFSA